MVQGDPSPTGGQDPPGDPVGRRGRGLEDGGRRQGGEEAGSGTGWLWGAPRPPPCFSGCIVRGSAATGVGLGLSNSEAAWIALKKLFPSRWRCGWQVQRPGQRSGKREEGPGRLGTEDGRPAVLVKPIHQDSIPAHKGAGLSGTPAFLAFPAKAACVSPSDSAAGSWAFSSIHGQQGNKAPLEVECLGGRAHGALG